MLDVISNVNKLIQFAGKDLDYNTWKLILDKIELVLTFCEKHDTSSCAAVFHDVINRIEDLLDCQQYNGNVDRVYSLINRCSHNRPESSVTRLIKYLFHKLRADPRWLENLSQLIEKFYIGNENVNIKIIVLQFLMGTIRYYKINYENELIEDVIKLHLNTDKVQDVNTKNHVVQMLLDLSLEFSPCRIDVFLSLLEKPLNEPFNSVRQAAPLTGENCIHVRTAVNGLIHLFKVSLFKLPSDNAVMILKILVHYLHKHYAHPELFGSLVEIRILVLEFILQLRVDSEDHLGVSGYEENDLYHSPFLLVSNYHKASVFKSLSVSGVGTGGADVDSLSRNTHYVQYVSLSEACEVVVTALRVELEWKVLSLIFRHFTDCLKNRALILSAEKDGEQLAFAVCNMISDKSLGLPAVLRNKPKIFTSYDFHSFLFPILISLISFRAYTEQQIERVLIKCLEIGLISWSAPQCISVFTICILEMHDSMVKLLPEVLLNLSKMSTTIDIASSMLEFLSVLAMFPTVFKNFVPEQYMSIFAITLPYTNSLRYNYYIICLAYRVISVWFLRCKQNLRRDFVRYITNALKSNIPIELSGKSRSAVSARPLINEDSSNRKRSSSLIEKASTKITKQKYSATAALAATAGSCLNISSRNNEVGSEKPSHCDSSMFLHCELIEICVDLMSRYTFASFPLPRQRNGYTNFLFETGHSMTWLLGLKLITITTSVCTQKPIRGTLCDNCSRICIFDKKTVASWRTGHDSGGGSKAAAASADLRYFKDKIKKPPSAGVAGNSGGSSSIFFDNQDEPYQDKVCSCWCQGWVEIQIRRPTGDTTWTLRLQNEISNASCVDPMADVSTLNLPTVMSKNLERMRHSTTMSFDHLSARNRSANVFTFPCAGSKNVVSECNEKNSPKVPFRQKSSESTGTTQNPTEKHRSTATAATHKSDCISSSLPQSSSDVKPSPAIRMIDNDCVVKNSDDDVDNDSESVADELHSKLSMECHSKAIDIPFHDKRATKSYSKEFRSNCCEVIPEESGTPPSSINSAVSLASSATILNGAEWTIEKQEPEKLVSTVTDGASVSRHSMNRSETDEHDDSSGSNKKSRFLKILDKNATGKKSELKISFPLNDPPVTSKPPLSPPFMWPKNRLQRASNFKTICEVNETEDNSTRQNLHSAAICSENAFGKLKNNYKNEESSVENSQGHNSTNSNPSFVFLQLYHSAYFGPVQETPLLLPSTPAVERALKVFDMIPPYETHKIGVIYVAPGQNNNEVEILRNQYGSMRYIYFIQKLGTLRKLIDSDPQNTFLGGLDRNGIDGKYAYIWEDDIVQAVFHIATMMPTEKTDPNCDNKKRHIGNDYVTIVFNESGEDYNMKSIKSQYNFACVVVEPTDLEESSKVTVKVTKDLKRYVGRIEPKIVSDQKAPLLARQLALHMNLASAVSCSLKNDRSDACPSNWLERLRKIKHIKELALKESVKGTTSSSSSHAVFNRMSSSNVDSRNSSNKSRLRKVHSYDFTEYT